MFILAIAESHLDYNSGWLRSYWNLRAYWTCSLGLQLHRHWTAPLEWHAGQPKASNCPMAYSTGSSWEKLGAQSDRKWFWETFYCDQSGIIRQFEMWQVWNKLLFHFFKMYTWLLSRLHVVLSSFSGPRYLLRKMLYDLHISLYLIWYYYLSHTFLWL